MSRNLLITGATGFIGRHFLKSVINDKSFEKIFSFQRKGGSSPQVLSKTSNADFRMIAGDISDKNSINYLEERLKGVKIHSVVHLAASMQMYAGNKEIDSVNVSGAVNIARIALKFGAERFVFAGSVEAGGPVSDEDDPGDEEIPSKPVNSYGLSKLKAEEQITQLMKKNPQTKFYLLRISNVYGPGSSFLGEDIAREIKKQGLLFHSLPFIGRNKVHPVYVEDVVKAFFLCLNNEYSQKSGIYNIAGLESMSLKRIFLEICRIMGDKELSAPDKSLLAYLKMKQQLIGDKIAKGGSLVSYFYGRPPRIHRSYSIKKARTYLGYSPRFVFPQGIELFRNSQFA